LLRQLQQERLAYAYIVNHGLCIEGAADHRSVVHVPSSNHPRSVQQPPKAIPPLPKAGQPCVISTLGWTISTPAHVCVSLKASTLKYIVLLLSRQLRKEGQNWGPPVQRVACPWHIYWLPHVVWFIPRWPCGVIFCVIKSIPLKYIGLLLSRQLLNAGAEVDLELSPICSHWEVGGASYWAAYG